MDKERAKNANILELAKRLGLNPKRAGSVYRCLCPVHTEKTPSFVLYPGTNSGHCFGCGFSADTIKLTEVVLNAGFLHAVEFITGEKHVPARELKPNPEPIIKRDYSHIYGAFRDFCIKEPGQQKRAVFEYLTGRGLKSDTLKKYGVFAVPDVHKVTDFLTSNFAAPELMDAGLIRNRSFCFADYPVIFPYCQGGKIQTLQGRTLTPDTSPKYRFLPGSGLSVFGGDLLEAGGGTVVICEGAVDTMSANQIFAGAVCVGVPGVTNFSCFPVEKLRKFERVILLLDNDKPGQNKALELFKTLKNGGLNVQSKHVPEPYKDINDWLQAMEPGGAADTPDKAQILAGFIAKNPALSTLIETFKLKII